jgi:hypothetical protein
MSILNVNRPHTRLYEDVQLDKRRAYYFRDANEVEWRFVWEPLEDISGWYVWQREPGEARWISIGTFPERRIIAVLGMQPEPFTLDDKIDFGLWLKGWNYGQESKDDANDSPKEPAPNEESPQTQG